MEFKKIYIDLVNKHSRNANVFFPQLVLIANRLGIKPEWIADVIYIESKFDPKAKNTNSTASGLIQFMEKTAFGLGTSSTTIRTLTNLQQIPYIERYLKGQIASFGKPRDWFETYLLVFYPVWVGKPETATLVQSAYFPNRQIDINKDGKITKGEFRIWANRQLPNSVLQSIPEIVKK